MIGELAAADGLPDTARAVDMRRTYPAGRILHLVPASLAFPAFGKPFQCHSDSTAGDTGSSQIEAAARRLLWQPELICEVR